MLQRLASVKLAHKSTVRHQKELMKFALNSTSNPDLLFPDVSEYSHKCCESFASLINDAYLQKFCKKDFRTASDCLCQKLRKDAGIDSVLDP